jgi:hypothetical protein
MATTNVGFNLSGFDLRCLAAVAAAGAFIGGAMGGLMGGLGGAFNSVVSGMTAGAGIGLISSLMGVIAAGGCRRCS